MSDNGANNVEYLQVKTFLYKYTPKFIVDKVAEQAATMKGTKADLTKLAKKMQKIEIDLTSANALTPNLTQIRTFWKAVLANPKVQNFVASGKVEVDTRDIMQTYIRQYQSQFRPGATLGDIDIYKEVTKSTAYTTNWKNSIWEKALLSELTGAGLGMSMTLDKIFGATRTEKQLDGQRVYTLAQTLGFSNISAFKFLDYLIVPSSSDIYGLITSDTFLGSPATGFTDYSDSWRQATFQTWVQEIRHILSHVDKLLEHRDKLVNQNKQLKKEFDAKVLKTYKIVKYNIDLHPKYFSKFNISDYVESYSFNQKIEDGSYNWRLACQDPIIPFSKFRGASNGKSKIQIPIVFKEPPMGVDHPFPSPVLYPEISAEYADSDGLLSLMAEYEVEDSIPADFKKNKEQIIQAILDRGVDPNTTEQENRDGIRLSDLIQKYNFISVFVYKGAIPFDQAKLKFGGTFDENNEVHLMLAGFRQEFNGFVLDKEFKREVGQVDSMSLSGQGILRLFSDTRTVVSQGLLTNGIYDAAEQATLMPMNSDGTYPVNIYQSLFQNKNPFEIVSILLDHIYRISLKKGTDPDREKSDPDTEYQGFYNIASLVQYNGTSTAPATSNRNLFVIPPFLLALVMALRNFNHQRPSDYDTPTSNVSLALTFNETNGKTPVATTFAEEYGGPCCQITGTSELYKVFFEMLRTGFQDYTTETKTPFEIIDDVRKYAFLEFFERPNGRIVLRSPQYNSLTRTREPATTTGSANAIFSSEYFVIGTSYEETGAGLVCRERANFPIPLVSDITQNLFQPAYADGKLMLQYGFRETTAIANPNVPAQIFKLQTNKALTEEEIKNLDLYRVIFYCLKMYLEIHNAKLKRGMISVVGNTDFEVGKMFVDEKNKKIGYITSVSKNCSIGKTYLATLQLGYVRDYGGTSDQSIEEQFRKLPTLEDLVAYGKTDLDSGVVVWNEVISSAVFMSAPKVQITANDLNVEQKESVTQAWQGLTGG